MSDEDPTKAGEDLASSHTQTQTGATEATGEPEAAPRETRKLPSTIGDYRVLALLGEGGMGIVYRAEQKNPSRDVALKVIKPGAASYHSLRRFKREAEVLGRLHHPGIAQIYEAGTADAGFGPLPFFAMELIQGRPIVDYADRHRLNANQRLGLMVQVCDAVEHAHERGILHRDLKPGNILVDQNGQAKVLDFGVARLMDSDAHLTRQTDMGQLIGTLAYMSPEQAVADHKALDRRSDVYALGVILYELLSSRLPYATHGKAMHEVVRAIREQDPAPLSTIHGNYRGDIDTIVAKALEKDRARRYASAAELAADIRRYLADEPITARPASTAYQLQKFVRRHRALVAGTTAVFLALVAGVVASTREAVRAHRAELAAQSQRARADQEAAAAKAVSDFLRNDVLAQASAATQASASTRPDPELKVRTALDRAAARITGKFDGQPDVEAAIRATIGRTYFQLGLYAPAREQLQEALDLYKRALGEEDPKTLITMSLLGRIVWSQGEYAQAEKLISRALKSERVVLGAEHPETLFAMNNLGNTYRAQGKNAEAAALYKETLDGRRRVLGPEHPDTLTSTNNLANVYWSEGRYAEAAALYSRTLEVQRRVLGPEHPDTLLSMANLADATGRQRDWARAETLFKETLEIQRRVLGAEHPRTLDTTADFAAMYQRQGKPALAEPLAAQVLAGRGHALGAEHPETMIAAADLAQAWLSLGKFRESERLAREALEFHKRKQPDDWQRFRAETLLGASLSGLKRFAEAEPLLLEGHRGMVERKESVGWMGASTGYYLDLAREWIVQLYERSAQPKKAAEWAKR